MTMPSPHRNSLSVLQRSSQGGSSDEDDDDEEEDDDQIEVERNGRGRRRSGRLRQGPAVKKASITERAYPLRDRKAVSYRLALSCE